MSKHQKVEILSWAIVCKHVQKNAKNPTNQTKKWAEIEREQYEYNIQ